MEEVARHLGLPETEMSLMEGGARPPAESELRALAKLYGTSAAFLADPDRAVPGWESFSELDEASADLSTADRNEILRFAQYLSSRSPDE